MTMKLEKITIKKIFQSTFAFDMYHVSYDTYNVVNAEKNKLMSKSEILELLGDYL